VPDPQAAPGALEQVRELLNSWLIPNDTREPTDRFDDLAGRRGWARREAAVARELRDDLRTAVDGGDRGMEFLNGWISRLDVRPAVAGGELSYLHAVGPAGDMLAAVLAAVGDGTWARLKTCPDCRWAFYDRTRNGSKRWCLMYAGGPDGRACGSIAKMRRYRGKTSAPGEG
jgi:predicted RNA-binding Zn ribbon-like protein